MEDENQKILRAILSGRFIRTRAYVIAHEGDEETQSDLHRDIQGHHSESTQETEDIDSNPNLD